MHEDFSRARFFLILVFFGGGGITEGQLKSQRGDYIQRKSRVNVFPPLHLPQTAHVWTGYHLNEA